MQSPVNTACSGSNDYYGRPVKVVFLAGNSYCGSTLMSCVLNEHPRIFSIGEMGPTELAETEDFGCSCGVILAECPFVRKVQTIMREKYGVPFDTRSWQLRHRYSTNPLANRLVLGSLGNPLLRFVRDRMLFLVPYYTRRMESCKKRNEAFIRASLEVSESSIFLDATKNPGRIPFLGSIPGIDLKILHLVRDPRGYAHSARKHQGKSPGTSAGEWVKTNRAIEDSLRRFDSGSWTRLNYEDFCRDPDAALRRLAGFMGVEHRPLPKDGTAAPHHIIGNAMRLRYSPSMPIKLDESWRKTLSPDDMHEIELVAGPTARSYGYEL